MIFKSSGRAMEGDRLLSRHRDITSYSRCMTTCQDDSTCQCTRNKVYTNIPGLMAQVRASTDLLTAIRGSRVVAAAPPYPSCSNRDSRSVI